VEVRFRYEIGLSWIGFGGGSFFQFARAGASGCCQILLLWGDGSTLSLSDRSRSLFGLSQSVRFGLGSSVGNRCLIRPGFFSGKL